MPRQVQRPLAVVPRMTLTKKEAAASLGMSVDTFERRVQPFLKVIVVGQLVLIPLAELERWVQANARHLVAQPS
jgi:excisionase family DNA binding protein